MPYEIPACAGKPYRPANGTEGMSFQSAFCWRCKHDDQEAAFGSDGACPILGASYRYSKDDPEYPPEWTHDERGRPTCTAFEEESDG